MKSLKLTEEHKSKLLEMCKVLFPEYNNVKVKCTFQGKINTVSKNIYFDQSTNIMFFPKKEMGDVDPYITYDKIHWFEFCMTHLITKIFESFEEDDESFYNRYINNGASFYGVGTKEMIFGMLESKKHLVDYLYQEFKNLNL